MNKKHKLLMCVGLFALLFGIFAASGGAQGSEARYVIVFHKGNLPVDVESLVSAAEGELLSWMPEVGIAVAASNIESFAETVGEVAAVEAVGVSGWWSIPETTTYIPEFDEPTIKDVFYPYQWNICRVGADQAWAEGVSGSHDTVVAVIDTGVDFSHPDLAPNFDYEVCRDGYREECSDPYIHWHGTHVAGIIAAAFGGGAVVGVGPNLGLAGYQVFEKDGKAYDHVIWWAILDAANEDVDVINMSLGRYSSFGGTKGGGAAIWTAWNRVVNYAIRSGVTVVASAGNYGINLKGKLYHIPGDLPGIINVAATGIREEPKYPQEDAYDVLAFYSNYGAPVTVVAPGGDLGPAINNEYYLILSTIPYGYLWAGGTSMAAAHVSALAGLIIDSNPRLNPHQVASIIKRTAEKIGKRQIFGHGMVDACAAIGCQ